MRAEGRRGASTGVGNAAAAALVAAVSAREAVEGSVGSAEAVAWLELPPAQWVARAEAGGGAVAIGEKVEPREG